MNKISLETIKNILTPPEMKNVLGGSEGCCVWESPTDWGCTDTAVAADFMATPSGWWACNNAEAIQRCC